jgi:hypothetical protein
MPAGLGVALGTQPNRSGEYQFAKTLDDYLSIYLTTNANLLINRPSYFEDFQLGENLIK